MDRERVLVTGGAGFIGRHLCDRLLTQGHHVTCVDDLSSSGGSALDPFLDQPRFTFLQQDVADPLDLDVERIFHLACPASPVLYQQDPIRTLMTAVQGTKSMLDLAQTTGARVLVTSTSEVYGDPAIHPQPEDYWGHVNPVGPRACYNEGKRAAEALAFDYVRQHGLSVRIVRLFNTYGPGMNAHDGRVVPSFIHDALAGRPIRVHGDGSQTRSFCYVSDVVDAVTRMMDTPDPVIGPVNIGNPEEVSMSRLAELVRDKSGSRSPVQLVDRPMDDPERRRPDISRAQSLLNWSPTTSLDVGLGRTIEHFRLMSLRDSARS